MVAGVMLRAASFATGNRLRSFSVPLHHRAQQKENLRAITPRGFPKFPINGKEELFRSLWSRRRRCRCRSWCRRSSRRQRITSLFGGTFNRLGSLSGLFGSSFTQSRSFLFSSFFDFSGLLLHCIFGFFQALSSGIDTIFGSLASRLDARGSSLFHGLSRLLRILSSFGCLWGLVTGTQTSSDQRDKE